MPIHSTCYQLVTLKMAQENPGYWHMVENMFREQAARILQRNYRKKLSKRHQREYSYKRKYNETLNAPLSLKFLKEPVDNSQEQIVKMKQGEWLNLNFNDSEFIRYIYKAARLNEISIAEMTTALLLHNAKIQFKCDRPNQIKRHRFDEQGPYNIKNISYSTDENRQEFFEKLSLLPESERYYFSINFYKYQEVAFLMFCLCNVNFDHLGQKKFRLALINFLIQDRQLFPEKNEKYSNLITILKKKYHENVSEADALKKDLLEIVTASLDNHRKDISFQDNSSIQFLESISVVGEQIPSYETSPDFDEKNPASPLLCFILPTVSAFVVLQNVMHGLDATDPFFSVGQISTRFIRDLDEKPEKYHLQKQARPVEIDHPDICGTYSVHGAVAHKFILTWHDLFHCWRSGANTNKPFIRHLRQLIEIETGFDMSKLIWKCVDMDFGAGVLLRTLKHLQELITIGHFRHLLSLAGWPASGITDLTKRSDVAFLFIIDMIKNSKKWPVNLIENNNFSNKIGIRALFLKTALILKSIIDLNPNKGNKFILLAFRLHHIPNGMLLCKLLDEKIGLNKILMWTRNNGLKLKSPYEVNGIHLDPFSATEEDDKPNHLYQQLFKHIALLVKPDEILFGNEDLTVELTEMLTAYASLSDEEFREKINVAELKQYLAGEKLSAEIYAVVSQFSLEKRRIFHESLSISNFKDLELRLKNLNKEQKKQFIECLTLEKIRDLSIRENDFLLPAITFLEVAQLSTYFNLFAEHELNKVVPDVTELHWRLLSLPKELGLEIAKNLPLPVLKHALGNLTSINFKSLKLRSDALLVALTRVYIDEQHLKKAKSRFSLFGSGISKENKINAAIALQQAIVNNGSIDLVEHKNALTHGRLAKIYGQF